IVSISLNAPDAKTYEQRCRPSFGEKSFQAMLDFAKDCKEYVPTVILSVVDCIDKEEIEQCRKIAQDVGVNYRIRTFI
ncbi:MAG: radical SAM protein, partial [Acutalibacteraceae bacterium]